MQSVPFLCRRLGLEEPVFLAAGATCQVYRVGEAVLRVAANRPGQQVQFQIDAALRRALLLLGVPVAQPLAVGEDWSLEAFVAGEVVQVLDTTKAFQIGQVVAALHSLPVSGWGLLDNQARPFLGQAASLAQGIQTRLRDAWPFGTTALALHP